MKNYSIDKKAILRNAVPLFIISGMLILFSLPFITIGVKSIISNYKYTEYTDVLEYNLTGNNNLAEYKYKVDDKEYSCIIEESRYNTKYIYYNPKNPTDCSHTRENIETKYLFVSVIILVFSGLCIYLGVKKINNYKILQKRGILIKNVPYNLSPIYVSSNGNRKQMDSVIKFTFIFPDGKEKNYSSERISYLKKKDIDDGKCDFLYDPENINNYFIDYKIDSIGGGSRVILYEFTDCYKFKNSKK